MKIIHNGIGASKAKMFKCKNCGCIFEALPGEYIMRRLTIGRIWCSTSCPWCEADCIHEDKSEAEAIAEILEHKYSGLTDE